jgi:hypothetical protein
MTEAQQLAEWLYANKDKQGTPEFEQKKARFFEVDSAPKAPARGEAAVKILQDEYIREYERVPKDAEDKVRQQGNLAALTRELATMKAQPPQMPTPAAEESPTLEGLSQDIGAIQAQQQKQQPDDMRLNAQIAGAAVGAVPGTVQQAMVMKDAGMRAGDSFANYVANKMQQRNVPSSVADIAEGVISGGIPQEVTEADLRRISTRFYQDHPEEIPNGLRASGGPGTYAYARRYQLPRELALSANDQKHAASLIAERAAGTEAAKAAFPSRTIVENPNSGIVTFGDEREPRQRLVIGGQQEPPSPPPAQPRSALPPAAPLTGAPQQRLTAGTSPFQSGRAALLQGAPAEPPIPPMTAGTPPPGVPGARVEPTLGAQQMPAIQGPAALGEARPTTAARAPVRSALDAVTGMFARNVTEPAQRVLGALPVIPKTLGGMQTFGGGAEALTGARQGDVGKAGTGAAEMLGGGLSMFNRTAPAGMAISILTELYRNARTPEDRQKIMDTLNNLMFSKQQVM